MRDSLRNIKCTFNRKITILKLLDKPRKGGMVLSIHFRSMGGNLATQLQRSASIATRSKFLRLYRVGQLLERLAKIGLFS